MRAAPAGSLSMKSTAPGSHSDSSRASSAAASRVCAGFATAGSSELRRRLRRGRIQSRAHFREQRIERIGDLLHRGFHRRRFARSRMAFSNARAADCTGLAPMFPATPLSVCAMRSASAVSPLASAAADLLERRTLLLDELAQQFQIQLPVSARRATGRPSCRGRRWTAVRPSATVLRLRGDRGLGGGRAPVCKTAPPSRTNCPDRSAWRRDRSCRRRDSAGVPRSWRARSWR